MNPIVIIIALTFVATLAIIISIVPNAKSISSVNRNYNAYAMTNGEVLHLYPANDQSILVHNSTKNTSNYFNKYSGNDGPYVYIANGIKYVLNWQGNNISIERVPNMRDTMPEYYVLGEQIPNDETVSYKGKYILTNPAEIGTVYQGEKPPGFEGYLYVHPSGRDIWVIYSGMLLLFKKYIENGIGYNAKTYKHENHAIIFYDDWNLQMIFTDKILNGTRI